MRGEDNKTEALFTYVTPESFVPKDHPLRAIRKMAEDALAGMDKLFDSIYASAGRPSIPPEKLLKAQLLMILYSIRSNRQLVEQIHYNFLFRWFLGMALDEKIWDHSSFSKNSERLIGSEVAAVFLSRILEQAKRKRLLSNEHFTVDGTLIEAWASIKSFKPKIRRMAHHPAAVAARTIPSTSRERSSITKPTARIPIPMPVCTARERPKRRSSAIRGTL